MALWTPANLSTQPRLRVSAPDAVWSGDNLTSIVNSGSDGGSATLVGTITKGLSTELGYGLNFGTTGDYLQFTLSEISTTANVSVFSLFRLEATGGNYGLVTGPGNWRANNCVGLYAAAIGIGVFGSANGYSGGSGTPPSFYTGSGTGYPNGFDQKLIGATIGSTNIFRREGVAETPATNNPGANTTLGSDDATNIWKVGAVDASGESLNGDITELMFFDVALTTDEYEKLEGWASWTYTGDGSLLPSGHPYELAAPEIATGGLDLSENGDILFSEAMFIGTTVGTLAVTENDDFVESTGIHLSTVATSSMTEDSDTVESTAVLALRAAATKTEDGDTLSSTVFNVKIGTVNITENDDVIISSLTKFPYFVETNNSSLPYAIQ